MKVFQDKNDKSVRHKISNSKSNSILLHCESQMNTDLNIYLTCAEREATAEVLLLLQIIMIMIIIAAIKIKSFHFFSFVYFCS